MPLLLLKTARRGFEEVPEIFFLMLLLILSLLVTFCDDISNYYLAAVLPAFLLTTSSTNRIPFPLYGSTLRRLLILAATWPINCLSIPSRVTIGFFPFSVTVFTAISLGRARNILCEYPKLSSSMLLGKALAL